MKIKDKLLSAFVFTVIFLYSNDANAYLDPGTGSLVLQAIIAFFAGAAALISLYWKKFKSFIKNLFSNDKKKE